MTDHFKDKAQSWDNIPWKQQSAEKIYQAIKKKYSLNKTERLLDFGGGTGLLAIKFYDDVKSISVIDTSAGMLEVLEQKVNTNKLSNVKAINSELKENFFENSSFDLIISMMAIHHVDDVTALFKIFHRILSTNGKVALIDLETEAGDFHPKDAVYIHNGFSKNEFTTYLTEAGFKNISIDVVEVITKETLNGETKDFPLLMACASKD